MKARGTMKQAIPCSGSRAVVIFEVNAPADGMGKYIDTDLDVTFDRHRNRRSLDANAYCWVLCQKLADALKSSKDEVYEELLQKYGYFLLNEDESPVTITVSSRVDMSRIDGHFRFCRESRDGRFKSYILIRGTSQYDSKEMAHFIDGLVHECREQGIETLPPDELARMVSSWKGTTA